MKFGRAPTTCSTFILRSLSSTRISTLLSGPFTRLMWSPTAEPG